MGVSCSSKRNQLINAVFSKKLHTKLAPQKNPLHDSKYGPPLLCEQIKGDDVCCRSGGKISNPANSDISKGNVTKLTDKNSSGKFSENAHASPPKKPALGSMYSNVKASKTADDKTVLLQQECLHAKHSAISNFRLNGGANRYKKGGMKTSRIEL